MTDVPKFTTVTEVSDEIMEEMKQLWMGKGESVDSDFYEDLDDVISDALEDNPSFFKELKKPKIREELKAKVLDEML